MITNQGASILAEAPVFLTRPRTRPRGPRKASSGLARNATPAIRPVTAGGVLPETTASAQAATSAAAAVDSIPEAPHRTIHGSAMHRSMAAAATVRPLDAAARREASSHASTDEIPAAREEKSLAQTAPPMPGRKGGERMKTHRGLLHA